MKKVFLTFAVTFIIAILALLFFTMMPQWTSDDVLLSEFSTERALEVKAISKQPHLVLKITIRLLVIYKRITKVRDCKLLYKGLDRMGKFSQVTEYLARIEGTSNN
jgi:hypothetical protein